MVVNIVELPRDSEILSLIDSSSCDELVLETEGIKLVVRRQVAGRALPPIATSGVEPARAAVTLLAPSSEVASLAKAPAVETSVDAAGFVGKPMVWARSITPHRPRIPLLSR